MKKGDEPIVVEQTFKANVEDTWRAITDVGQMRQWYFDNIPSFRAEVGFETRFNVKSEGRDFMHLWKITEAVPLQKLTHDWKFDGYPGDAFIVWELFEHEGGTRLRLSTHVRESFPDDIPEFKRGSCLAGWEYFIKERLKGFLDEA